MVETEQGLEEPPPGVRRGTSGPDGDVDPAVAGAGSDGGRVQRIANQGRPIEAGLGVRPVPPAKADIPSAAAAGPCPCPGGESLRSRVAVVIPAYNEAATIADVAGRALAQTPLVIVVDDGSTDGTAARLAGLPVLLLRHPENRGKAASLVDGFAEALRRGASAVITLDGDGQHRPEDIPKFLERAAAAPQAIVTGSRLADRAAFPSARYRANRIANFWISWACRHPIEDSQCGFRLYPRRVLESVRASHARRHGFVFESEILINAARAGYRSTAVPIPALYAEKPQRPSHFRPVADITRIVIMVAGKLLSRGMDPVGLMRSLKPAAGSGNALKG